MYNNISTYITIVNNRIFFDIASSGCGSGCKYCYVKGFAEPQILIDIGVIEEICDYLIELYSNQSYIVSFCPNTEPLKSSKSIELICRAIEKLSNKGFIFQISTKEVISLTTLETINNLCTFDQQVFINISVPVINKSSICEPNCPSAEQRLYNIPNIANFSGISSCIYVKPFFTETANDAKQYIEWLLKFSPDYVVVGFEFIDKNNSMPCTTLHHQDSASLLLSNDMSDMHSYIENLESIFVHKINYSSICNIYQRFRLPCDIQLYCHNEQYCTNCEVR